MPCYFFSGTDYIRVTRDYLGPGTVDPGYPKPISDWQWGAFGKNGIDAALNSGPVDYFFSGDQYIRVTRGETGSGKVDAGYPKPISTWNWGAFGKNGIDAALSSGSVDYFFSGDQYIRVTRGDTGPGIVDPGYPKPISTWNWGEFGKNGIDAALSSGPVDYFFSGDQYIRVTRGDTGPGKVDPGYPAPISNWQWGAFGRNGIKAALFSGEDVAPTAQPISFTIGLDSFSILNTRSRHEDTDFVSVGVTVPGQTDKQINTQPLGNLNNGNFDLKMYFQNITLNKDQSVVLTYHMINAGHTDGGQVVQSLEAATDALVGKAATAVATAVAGAIGAALGASIGTAAIPLIGSALGALAGWLTNTAWGIVFADCDGPVASAVHVLTYDQIQSALASGQGLVETDDHPGINSPAGCGSNSHYTVTWSVR